MCIYIHTRTYPNEYVYTQEYMWLLWILRSGRVPRAPGHTRAAGGRPRLHLAPVPISGAGLGPGLQLGLPIKGELGLF